MSMPKLPEGKLGVVRVFYPDGSSALRSAYSSEQLISFGLAIAEECAARCKEIGPELVKWWGVEAANAAAEECAAAILKAKDEIGK